MQPYYLYISIWLASELAEKKNILKYEEERTRFVIDTHSTSSWGSRGTWGSTSMGRPSWGSRGTWGSTSPGTPSWGSRGTWGSASSWPGLLPHLPPPRRLKVSRTSFLEQFSLRLPQTCFYDVKTETCEKSYFKYPNVIKDNY